ncbi:hypothetical protein PpBr36_00075 [Pyricularia pennisetigena]|uniref:hypothetical protein n=1 Tax=Pyricularia pennisetigena TaxID=1578925 RepID=UPI00114EDB05|nr:hypothetical protein PpBr36_00075 [Pyricularia pennisetigena]TLS28081.1 hypothetical protein PpBr36_00075 [Pyricularia pennisetigena]
MKSSWLHMLGPSTVAILAQSPPPLQSLTFFSLGFQPLDVIGPSDIMQLVGYCIDMTYAFVTMLLGPELAGTVIKVLEYEPRTEQNWDPYPVVHNIPGAETCRSLGECVGPAGYEFGCGKE